MTATKTTLVNPAEYARLVRPVTVYSCCACQAVHAEGESLFAPHLYRQSKHGLATRPASPADVLRRLAGEGDNGMG